MFRKWIALFLWAVPFTCAAQNIDLLILNKSYNEALFQINKNLKVRPDADLYFKQGVIYRQLSEPLNAERSFKNSVALDSANSKYLAECADLQIDIGNPIKAITFYQRAIHYSPEDFNLKYKLGKAFINAEDYQKAYDFFMMLRYKDSTNVVYNKQLGLMALRTGKINQAIELFESVLEYNPNDFSTYMNLISSYSQIKDAVHIVRTIDRALYFFPENSVILLRGANSLYAIAEYEEAKPSYERYLAKNDSTLDILKNYGITLYFCSEPEKAISLLETYFYRDPNEAFVNFYLGLAYRDIRNLSRSAEFLEMAVASAQPVYLAEMCHHLGKVYGLNREFELSIKALQKAFYFNNKKVELLCEIAKTYEEFNPDKKLALNYYSQYLKEAGDSAVNSEYAQDRINKIKWETYHKKTNKNPKR
jgi:tetratricopeptide (TPR) repeat protein